jgi:polyvinyl alcohol dehydrogenase (cytochrome)
MAQGVGELEFARLLSHNDTDRLILLATIGQHVLEPHQGLAQAAVSVAAGVLYASSLDGYLYAIDAATGAVLWESLGEGSSNAGPAIVDGSLCWGNGCARAGIGTASRTFYSFTVPAPSHTRR